MATVIAISGKKQSGKTSLAYYLKAKLILENSPFVGPQPEIIQNEEGEVFFKFPDSLLEVKDIENSIVEIYSFGDTLKECCMYTLGLTYEQCYGTDEQKNTFTKYLWNNLPINIRKKYALEFNVEEKENHTIDDSGQFGFTNKVEIKTARPRGGHMTAREVMQIFGTEICREMFHDDIWVDATFKKINRDKVEVAIIADVRFPSEINAIKELPDYKLVRLSRKYDVADEHSSETSLDNFDWDSLGNNVFVLNNENMSIEKKNELVYCWLNK